MATSGPRRYRSLFHSEPPPRSAATKRCKSPPAFTRSSIFRRAGSPSPSMLLRLKKHTCRHRNGESSHRHSPCNNRLREESKPRRKTGLPPCRRSEEGPGHASMAAKLYNLVMLRLGGAMNPRAEPASRDSVWRQCPMSIHDASNSPASRRGRSTASPAGS